MKIGNILLLLHSVNHSKHPMSRIHVVVNTDYRNFIKQFAELPETFGSSGTSIFEGRNSVRLIGFDGVSLVVKRFKVLRGIKSIIYRFRSTKAFRAYKHGLMLLDIGISTPEPAGFAVMYGKFGLPTESFYISQYTPLPNLASFFGKDDDFDKAVIKAFAAFVAELHRKGVVFDDLNSTNVLVKTDSEGIATFSLIDINRMRFMPPGSLNLNQRFRNISRICYDRPALYKYFIEQYVKAVKVDLQHTENSHISEEILIAEGLKTKKHCDKARRRLYAIKHPFRKK